MHYGIVAIGSRGDVQPYIALALGLKSRGREATVMAHENFKDFVEGYGVAFTPIKGDVEAMLHSDEGMQMLKKGNIVAFSRYLRKTTLKTADSVIADIFDSCAKADILIASLLAVPWVEGIAEKLGKPWAIVQLNLPTVPTKAFPMAAMGRFDFPTYNRMTYRLYAFVYDKTGEKIVDAFRASIGLPGRKISLLKKIEADNILNLHCFSPSLLPRPDDWAPQNLITGFLFLPVTVNEQIPGDLVRWLNAGEKPVYIGFGSIPVPDPNKFQAILTELLEKTNQRFVFCRGWSLPIHMQDHPRLFQIKSISHQWLLPHCNAAIIHGGVGTTAAVLKAKIPVIIVSIIADQPWWGRIIERKKLGLHIPLKKLTTQKLMAAIETIHDLEIRQNAVAMGERINREDGLGQTIEALEKFFTC
jgi:sterol 3beta-glucosyltransferase